MKEINEQIIERYMLSIERIRRITEEETTEVLYRDYFRKVSEFILKINEIRERMQDKPFEQCTLYELKRENESIYADVVGDQIQVMRIRHMRFLCLEKKSDSF